MNKLRWRALKLVEMLEDFYWDRELGIKTRFRLDVHEMNYLGEEILNARAYEPTPYRSLLSAFSICGIEDFEQYQFIDYGCGAGRATLFAAKLGFERGIGIDFDSGLIDRANNNLKRFVAKNSLGEGKVEFICDSV